MQRRSQQVFLLLVWAQAAHSIEEYVSKFYEEFAPARFFSGLVSGDLAVGFVGLNSAIVVLGLVCYFFLVRSGHRSARGVAWAWVILELINGLGHSVLGLSRGSYFPGAFTAPLLLGVAGWLAVLLIQRGEHPGEKAG